MKKKKVKCNGCRYLAGYEEYGQEFIYCTHPTASLENEEENLDRMDTEKERDCRHWASIYQKEPHELYMRKFAEMKIIN